MDRIDRVNRRVQFRTSVVDQLVIAAPDPRIIALHAACARIAHMSGAAEVLEEVYRDTEAIPLMTEPNAVYELHRALRAVQLVQSLA